jgi:uncharacterized membrane protein
MKEKKSIQHYSRRLFSLEPFFREKTDRFAVEIEILGLILVLKSGANEKTRGGLYLAATYLLVARVIRAIVFWAIRGINVCTVLSSVCHPVNIV